MMEALFVTITPILLFLLIYAVVVLVAWAESRQIYAVFTLALVAMTLLMVGVITGYQTATY